MDGRMEPEEELPLVGRTSNPEQRCANHMKTLKRKFRAIIKGNVPYKNLSAAKKATGRNGKSLEGRELFPLPHRCKWHLGIWINCALGKVGWNAGGVWFQSWHWDQSQSHFNADKETLPLGKMGNV